MDDVEGAGPPVRDLTDADECDCCDWGRTVVSGASSKVSWRPLSARTSGKPVASLTPSRSELSALESLDS